jgi:hypothetical protein
MNRHSRQQRGAILIMVAIAAVVIIGIGALALDLGRLFVQKTELQNAADAAALAAAVELDGASDAQTRAKAAARQLLNDRGIFVSAAGDFTAEEDITDFKFYSDIDPVKLPGVNGGAGAAESRFVSLTVDLTQEGEGLQLFFLPVLRLIPGVDAPTEEGTRASALAGIENVPCYQPAMFMCVDDINSLPADVGDMIWLRQHGGKGSDWTAGNFGFLLPDESKSGAPDLQQYLADVGHELCVAGAQYASKTGQVAQKSKQGINTRFDIYEGGLKEEDYPPAPNIITYPKDINLVTEPDADSFRVGDGEWARDAYWDKYHSHHTDIPDEASRPSGWDSWTRWQTYLWEMDLNDDLEPQGNPHMPLDVAAWGPPPVVGSNCDPAVDHYPNDCHGEPDPDHFYCSSDANKFDGANCSQLYTDMYTGVPGSIPYPAADSNPETKTDDPPYTHANRRVIYVAALECETLGLTGAFDEGDVDVLKEGKIMQFLLTKYATNPGGDPDKFEIFGEYIGPTEEGAGQVRRIIQLYE